MVSLTSTSDKNRDKLAIDKTMDQPSDSVKSTIGATKRKILNGSIDQQNSTNESNFGWLRASVETQKQRDTFRRKNGRRRNIDTIRTTMVTSTSAADKASDKHAIDRTMDHPSGQRYH